MNKRTVLLAALLLALGGVTWLATRAQDSETQAAGADRDFAVRDAEQIHKIFIADRQDARTTLTRKGDHWVVNDSFKVREDAIRNVLDAITRIEMKYKPPQSAVSGMIKSLSSEGIKVEVYGKGDALLKTLYIGGSTADERGTFVMLEGATQPYVAHIPSWEGNLRFRFTLRGDDWRDRSVFAHEIEGIQSVTVDYPKQRDRSFRLFRVGNDFKVAPFYEVTPAIQKTVLPGKIERYLLGYKKIVAASFENKRNLQDSVKSLIPFVIITLTDTNGKVTEARFHPDGGDMVTDPKTGAILSGGQAESYLTDLPQSNDLMQTQHILVSKLFWGYDFFYTE